MLIPHTRFVLADEPSSILRLSKSIDEIPTRPTWRRFRIRHEESECEQASEECGRLPRLFPRLPKKRLLEISRKEVIQPQVPLRLPCYDFAPVTELTFDGCLSCELAHRLQVPPASMA